MKKSLLLLAMAICTLPGFSQTWDEVIKIVASDRDTEDKFGVSVSISGNRAIVGAYYEDEDALGGNTLIDAGSAYIFELSGGSWVQTAKLVADARVTEAFFGRSVDIIGDRVIVGANGDTQDAFGGNPLYNAGAAYIFDLVGGTWMQTAKLVASDRQADDRFGGSVSISGDKVIVGASNEDEDVSGANTMSNAGSAYIFELTGGSWSQAAKLVSADRGAEDSFGISVSMIGDKAIVGAYNEAEDALGGNTVSGAGSAYIFEFTGGSWIQTAKLVASDRQLYDSFGISTSISGNRVIIGAYNESEDALGGNTLLGAGSAYIFELSGGSWVQTAKLVSNDRDANDLFGRSVDISGTRAIVGAFQDGEDTSGGNSFTYAGSAYIFELTGGSWTQTTKMVASDRGVYDYFGSSVSISGDQVIVSASSDGEDATGGNTLYAAGSAYMFQFNCLTPAPTGNANQSFCEPASVSNLAATGTSVNWYDSATSTTVLNGTDVLADGATYYATNSDNGCESNTRLAVTVTVNPLPSNTVTVSGMTLTAAATGASYQWIDCDNGNTAISGATNQTYTALATGNYAVALQQNSCSDTSACFLVDNVGLNNLQQNGLLIYPNPSNGVFTIEFSGKLNKITVLDLSGRTVSVDVDLNSGKVDARNVAPGNYIIQVTTNEQEVVLKSISIQ